MSTQLLHQMHELHSRIADGTVMVAEDERALDVFHHPYAYAALRGIA